MKRKSPDFLMTALFAVMMFSVSVAFYWATDPRPVCGRASKDCKLAPYVILINALGLGK